MTIVLEQYLHLEAKRVTEFRKDPEEMNTIIIHAIERNLAYLRQQ